MFSYKIENLRRIESTPWLKIHPITILVGRNSAGKSTFLRSFPLFKQSIDVKSSAPLLWYEQDGVDFGDFETALHTNAKSDEILFHFGIEPMTDKERILTAKYSAGFDYSAYRYFRSPYETFTNPDFDITYGLKSEGKKTVRSRVQLETKNFKLEIDPVTGSSTFLSKETGEKQNITQKYGMTVKFFESHLFSEPIYRIKRSSKTGDEASIHRRVVLGGYLKTILDKDLKGKISDERIYQLINQSLECDSFDALLEEQGSAFELKTVKSLLYKMQNSKDAEARKSIDDALAANMLLQCLERAARHLTTRMRNIRYIGPARVRSERYYRQQELYVSEIAPDGRNLPMFLASLSDAQRRGFSTWVKEIFGYGVRYQNTTGHISIAIESNGKVVNAVDTGYGVSQVLPVLAQVWWFSKGRDIRSSTVTLAIEQPELHLHPAHQALIADILVGTVKSSGSQSVNYIIETHSESLINRLGELVSSGVMSSDDIQIIIFSSEGELETPEISTATFDNNGILRNWPFGFFNYDVK